MKKEAAFDLVAQAIEQGGFLRYRKDYSPLKWRFKHLAVLRKRLQEKAEDIVQKYRADLYAELDKVAREEVAAIGINLTKWARVSLDRDKITIELVNRAPRSTEKGG